MKFVYKNVYPINIDGKSYKGIYLGEKTSENRLEKYHVMMINNPCFNEKDSRIESDFSIITFGNYAFRSLYEDWVLEIKSTIEEIFTVEREYLQELYKKFG